MDNFSKLVEKIKSKKYFRVKAGMDLTLEVNSNEFSVDNIDEYISKFAECVSHTIENVEEISKDEFNSIRGNEVNESFSNYMKTLDRNLSPDVKINMAWENKGSMDKYEFYHQMRNLGYDPYVIKQSIKSEIW